jgi:DNA-binding transcriptional ArsR family regulator
MLTLARSLATEPLSVLRSLALWWGIEPPVALTADTRLKLERAMRDQIAARFVWDRLNPAERQVLYAIVGPSARNWITIEGLPERTKLSPAVVSKALKRLVEAHLVLREPAKLQGGELVGQRATFYGYIAPRNPQAEIVECEIVYVPTELATGLYATGRELYVSGADRSGQPLDELLKPFRQGDLEQLGRRYGLNLATYYSRNEVRESVAQNIAQAEAVRYALEQVRPDVSETFGWLVDHDGRAKVAELREQFDLSDAGLSTMLHLLEDYALAFDTFSGDQRVVFIPNETLDNLDRATKRPQQPRGLQIVDEPRSVQPGDPTFLWDLIALIAAATHQDVDLTRSGALPKRTAQRLLPSMVTARAKVTANNTSFAYLEMLRQIALDLGLVAVPLDAARTQLRPGRGLDSWSRHDEVMQARRLLRRWPSDRAWQDLPGAHFKDWMAFYIEPQMAREQVLLHLRKCQPGVWYSLASFGALILGDDPYVLRPRQRFAGDAAFRLADDMRLHWEECDGELITGIFGSTLAELGLVSLGYDTEGVPGPSEQVNPTAFMLTEMGYEVLMKEGSAAQLPSPRPLILQPNFQVLVMEPSMPVHYMLVRFAVLGQAGRVSRFTLSRETLTHALDAGLTIDAILSFLEAASTREVPQNIAYTLRDWARQHQQSAIAAEVALDLPNEQLAEEIITSPHLRAFRPQRIGPKRIAFARQGNLRELIKILEKLGYGKRLRSGLEALRGAVA